MSLGGAGLFWGVRCAALGRRMGNGILSAFDPRGLYGLGLGAVRQAKPDSVESYKPHGIHVRRHHVTLLLAVQKDGNISINVANLTYPTMFTMFLSDVKTQSRPMHSIPNDS